MKSPVRSWWLDIGAHPRLVQNYRAVLTGGFGLLFVIAVVGGSLIVFFGSRVQDDIQNVQGSYAEGVRVFGEIESNMSLLRVHIRDEVYGASDKNHRSMRKQIDSLTRSIFQMLDEYEPYLTLPDERDKFHKYVAAFNEYEKGFYAVLDSSRHMERTKAIGLLVERLGPERNRLDDDAQALFSRSAQIALAINRDVDILQKRFVWQSYSILALSLLIGGFIYLFVLHTIRSHIEGVTSAREEKNELLNLLTERQKVIEKLVVDLESSVEDERKRFSQELHDAIGHGLTISILNVESALLDIQSMTSPVTGFLENALESMKEVLADSKRISYELRPPLLDDFGLSGAVKQFGRDFQKKTGISVELLIDENIPHLPSRQEISLYRIVQEAFTNIEKHSGAKNATLQLILREGGSLALSIIDDGRGIDGRRNNGGAMNHLGLRNMRERINLMGGTMIVNSVPHKGVEIIIEVPVQKEAAR